MLPFQNLSLLYCKSLYSVCLFCLGEMKVWLKSGILQRDVFNNFLVVLDCVSLTHIELPGPSWSQPLNFFYLGVNSLDFNIVICMANTNYCIKKKYSITIGQKATTMWGLNKLLRTFVFSRTWYKFSVKRTLIPYENTVFIWAVLVFYTSVRLPQSVEQFQSQP